MSPRRHFPNSLRVLFGSSVSAPEAWILRVSHAELHPTYRQRGVGLDLALLVLEDAVDPGSVPPLSLDLQQRITVTAGAVVTVVGFGQSDAQDAVPGHKRSGKPASRRCKISHSASSKLPR